jgi:tetratricopeptide (TPR) repeat protein
MKRGSLLFLVAAAVLASSCTTTRPGGTLAELHRVPADTTEVDVSDSLERAMQSYRRYLNETPDNAMTPEAMRRLADLQIEQQYGIMGDGEIVELPAPERSALEARIGDAAAAPGSSNADFADLTESDEAFEQRTTSQFQFDPFDASSDVELPEDAPSPSLSGPLEAIRIYQKILTEYPSYERADQVLYQMARAYDEVGQPDDAMAVLDRLVSDYGYSDYIDEVQFRRGEYLFTRRNFRDAEDAYGAIIATGPGSQYYELALYKLGWALYKQEFYDEALNRFMALLDYKLSIGYDFDESHSEEDERRVADTFRVISLSFSNIGGPEVVNEYFSTFGRRSYEDRIYSNLGEFYLAKLRYQDAAAVYASFIDLNPFHRVAPKFGMRIIDIYAEGGFPLLVVESKKDFANKYGLNSEYWDYFEPGDSPEVLGFLKANLTDLANHYHSLYQDEELADDRAANFAEASRWYREFLTSFPADPESPAINYQLADLLLENEDFAGAAREYERTAYDYDPHEKASDAGYAAIFAHREYLKVVDETTKPEALRATVDSSLRFADTFPEHESAPIVLGAAADDLYDMKDYETAIMAATKLIERYPASDPDLRRAAWTVVAHASFDLARYPEAERAYMSVLEFVPEDDEERPSLVDNLAASIYEQGQQANEAGDYRAAADNFLRIGEVAPSSEIRSSAEYDAAAALIRLEDWAAAGRVLEDFRASFPGHELQKDVTKQLANVYHQSGQLDRSAGEYERVAAESDDPELQREALLEAGELYEEGADIDSALDVYARYIESFPRPLDVAQETRFKMAGMYEKRGAIDQYHEMLRSVVAADDSAGDDRTDRSRYLAAQSALVLTEQLFDRFAKIELKQPFEQSLAEKQASMDESLAAFEGLVDYEVSDVTAAATYYIAEIYYNFSQSLINSERPNDLSSDELGDYELAIEDQAYPFEERAIDVHEQNYQLIFSGVFNPWVQRSLAKLAEVVPGRYAKSEISSGYLDSIDVYAYRSPGAPLDDAVADSKAASSGTGQAQARVVETGGPDAH